MHTLGGSSPVVMDVPVYDATSLVAGEMIMRGGAGGTTNAYYVSAAGGSNAATDADDALGVLQEAPADSTITTAAGNAFAKCIINQDAVYIAEYLQTSGNVIDVTTASTSTTLTITSLEDNIDGGWVYFTNKTTAAALGAGELRYLTASASGSATLSAVTVDTSSDCIKILPLNHQLVALSADATALTSIAAASSTTDLMNIENFIQVNGVRVPLRYSQHDNTSGYASDQTKLYSALVMLNHAFIKDN